MPIPSTPIRHHAQMATDPSHAVISTFDVDPARREEQDFGLRNVIVPGVVGAPGFVSGIWTLSEDGTKSTVLVAFIGEDAARAFQASVRANAANQASAGLTLTDSVVAAVGAFASA